MEMMADGSPDDMFARLAYGTEAGGSDQQQQRCGMLFDEPTAHAQEPSPDFMHQLAQDSEYMVGAGTGLPPLLDPFAEGELDDAMHMHSGMMHTKYEHVDLGSLPPFHSHDRSASPTQFQQSAGSEVHMAMKFEAVVSNAHLPMRQNATPNPPMPYGGLPHHPVVKCEPLSPATTVSHLTSPLSHQSSPMMPSLPPAAMSSAAPSPLLQGVGAMRSSSSAGSSASGSGGSGANSAAHSCSSSEHSDSDASFDDEPVSKKKGKAAAANKGSAKKGRKRKSKSGSGNTSETAGAGEHGDEVGTATVGLLGDAPVESNKRQQRLQRNRASAQLSRERKKQYQRLLEKQLKEMSDINEGLCAQVSALTTENTALKARLSALSMRERVQGRYGAGAGRAAAAASQQPAYASSQASTASLQSSPRPAGDADSLGSNPTSPASNGTEVDVPHAKRVRVQAYNDRPQSPSSQRGSGAAFNAKAGMLLFTLVMSVGLLVNWAEVQPHMSASFVADMGVTAGAALVNSRGGHGGIVTLPTRGRVLSSISDSSSEADASAADAFALVPAGSNVPSSSSMEITLEDGADSKAIDVYSRSSRDLESKLSPATATVNMGGLKATPATGDVALLRRLLLSANGNLSTANTPSESSNYMFCPQALSITNDVWTGLLKTHGIVANGSQREGTPSELLDDESSSLALVTGGRGAGAGQKRTRSGKTKASSAGRLRKAIGLPALPAPDGGDAGNGSGGPMLDPSSTLLLSELSALPAVQHGLQVGDKLLLWVPLQLATDSAPHQQQHGSNATVEEAPKQGLVEIACNIAHVRPIVLS